MAGKHSEAAPATVDVVNVSNEKVGTVNLPPSVFGVKVNDHLIYEAVKHHRAGVRRGTHATKTRAMVSGTGRKPWRQKGTGRARVGESRNPLWRHGGVVFGPSPRDYSYHMPKKALRAALRSALTQRLQEDALRVVESLPVTVPAERPFRLTKQLADILQGLAITGKTMIVVHEPAPALVLAVRNLPGVRMADAFHLTVYDVLDCRHLLVCRPAVDELEERLAL